MLQLHDRSIKILLNLLFLILVCFFFFFFLFFFQQTYANGLRFVLTILGGAISVMGSKAIKYPSAGALGCVTVAFVAGIGWKRQQKRMTPQQQQAYETVSLRWYNLYFFILVFILSCPLVCFSFLL